MPALRNALITSKEYVNSYQCYYYYYSFLIIDISIYSLFAELYIETFPDSLIKPDLCNLNAPGLACDPDQLLRRFNQTLSGAEYLSHYLQQIRYATKCPCLKDDNLYGHCSTINPRGYTISIAVMRSIEMINDDMMNTVSRNRTVQVFAEMLRRRQHRGQCADDALIVAITDWKIVYTSVDEVIGRALTTSAITEVNREAESLFTSANYLYGLTFMVNRYGQILQYSERKSLSMICQNHKKPVDL
uniref:ANF_receptor domain-containing protein n=1 Tax=Loa loa TaxID=7209 RepID=A0A1I7VZ82_LOALO